MKEKLVTASNTEKLQILTLVADSWSRKYYSEYFGVSKYLIRSKKLLILFMLYTRMLNTANTFPSKRIMYAHRNVFTKWLVLCNLHELFVAFKERNGM